MADSDSGQEKTEEATSRKLDKAREEGQVPRSKELTALAVTLAGILSIILFFGLLAGTLTEITEDLFSPSRRLIFDTFGLSHALVNAVQVLFNDLIIILSILFLTAIVASVSLGGWNISPKALTPKLSRMDPLKGIKRMFSTNSLMEMLKSFMKFLLLAVISSLVIYFNMNEMILISLMNVEDAIDFSVSLVGWLFMVVASGLVIVVAIDVPYQLWQHSHQLKMTKQEVKDEYKDAEGKPEVKSRIRQAQREIMQKRMMDSVPKADVVITNPTHFAVALKYKQHEDPAPILLAKGKGLIAHNIKEKANDHGVVMIESAILARAIYFTTDVNHEIPEGLYYVVAKVLAYVYQLNLYKKGMTQAPVTQPVFEVPNEFKHDENGKPEFD